MRKNTSIGTQIEILVEDFDPVVSYCACELEIHMCDTMVDKLSEEFVDTGLRIARYLNTPIVVDNGVAYGYIKLVAILAERKVT